MGHYTVNILSSTANSCTGLQSLQVRLTMAQKTTKITATDIINTNWIMLDTCYSIISVSNKDLVQDIYDDDTGK